MMTKRSSMALSCTAYRRLIYPISFWNYPTTMTTNHRPTLESKRGRANVIKDTIQHSRSQNGQTLLKLRLDISGSKIEPTLGKRGFQELEEGTKMRKRDEKLAGDIKSKSVDGLVRPDDAGTGEPASTRESGGPDSDSDSDSESEDSDTEALMAELAKIRQEKEAKKKEQSALKGNPLLSIDEEPASKKGWRSNTAFSRSKRTKEDPEFTTDTLNSDTHRKFLSKYVR